MSLRSILLSMVAVSVCAAQQPNPAKTQPDNTKVNKEDRDKREPTADQAKQSGLDRDRMQKIRQAIMDDKSLSTYAHNVKVISQNGKVTLRGPVRSEEEKATVEAKATAVAGQGNVINKMTIKVDKDTAKRPKTS